MQIGKIYKTNISVSYTHQMCIRDSLILFAGKLFAGMFSGAISITADAFNLSLIHI